MSKKLSKKNHRFALSNIDAYEGQYRNTDGTSQQQSIRRSSTMGEMGYQSNKWPKSTPMGSIHMIGDMGDGRHGYAPTVSRQEIQGSKMDNNILSKKNWKFINTRYDDGVTIQKRVRNDDGDANIVEISTEIQEKQSEVDEEIDSLMSAYHSREASLSMIASNGSRCSIRAITDSKEDSDKLSVGMNFIMLLGLILGVVVSKVLQYLLIYFEWLLDQVVQLRQAFIGDDSFVDFINSEDTSRYGVRTKMILLPLVVCCNVLYFILCSLRYMIGFVLTGAPNSLVLFVHKLSDA